jgi:hypothetical protein
VEIPISVGVISEGEIMVNVRVIARAGLLAIGFGIGAATMPVMASADTDFQISIDGHDLFPTVDNSAQATSGSGDIAIAYGDNSYADAEGGTGDFAEAIGTSSDAEAGGSGSVGASNFDSAIDIGNNVGSTHGAFALYGDNNTAIVEAPDSYAASGGDLFNPSITGSDNTSFILNPFGAGGDYAYSGATEPNPGNFDLAEILFGDNVNAGAATGADYLYDIWSPLGESAGAAAATGTSNWLTDLLSLF